MKRAIYAIRHQAAGVLLQTLSTARPSDEEVERVRKAHGRPGKDDWARVVTVSLDVAPEHAAFAEVLDAIPEEPPAPPPEPGMPRLVVRGRGTVTPPKQ